MKTRSPIQRIFFGIWLLTIVAVLVFAFHEYRSGHHTEAYLWLFYIPFSASFSYAGKKNQEFVDSNMRKFGLKPDRD